jgi:hypothetical protein
MRWIALHEQRPSAAALIILVLAARRSAPSLLDISFVRASLNVRLLHKMASGAIISSFRTHKVARAARDPDRSLLKRRARTSTLRASDR